MIQFLNKVINKIMKVLKYIAYVFVVVFWIICYPFNRASYQLSKSKSTSALNQTFSGSRATRTLFAVGAYQIIPETMPVAILDSGLSESDSFSPDNQDKLGLALIYGRKRPKLRNWTRSLAIFRRP